MHIIDTIMTLVNLRIHIAPVGYEIDRIVLPAQKMKADKVFLMIHDNPSKDRAIAFYEKIQKQLKKQNIEVELKPHDRQNVFSVIKTVKKIIHQEPGNSISVNLASGSKIQAIGCMMACMMFNDSNNVQPFYVEPKKYLGFSGKPISEGIAAINQIPTYVIKKPDERHIQALKIVVDNGGKISKKDMAKKALEKNLITVNAENRSQATFASLDKNIISPMENQWGFLNVEKLGRTRWITITDEGKYAAEFLI